MLRTKSVWTPINRKTDGLRILVTRFRGRGLPGSRYDVWMPSLGPSERLLGAGQGRRQAPGECAGQGQPSYDEAVAEASDLAFAKGHQLMQRFLE